MNLAALKMAQVIHKLEWSAGSEWSAHITPEESQLLLKHVTKPKGCKCQDIRPGQRSGESEAAKATEKQTTHSGEFVD